MIINNSSLVRLFLLCTEAEKVMIPHLQGFSGDTIGKKKTYLPMQAGEMRCGLDPWVERSPGEGNGNPLQYSGLENPMDRGAWWATVQWVTTSQTRPKQKTPHLQIQRSSKGNFFIGDARASLYLPPSSVASFILFLPPLFFYFKNIYTKSIKS